MKDANKPLGVLPKGKISRKSLTRTFPLIVHNKIQGKSNYQLEMGDGTLPLYPSIKHSFIPSYTTVTHTVPSRPRRNFCRDQAGVKMMALCSPICNILVLADLIAFTIISA